MTTDATMTTARTLPVPPFTEAWLCIEFWPLHDKSWRDAAPNITLHATEAEAVADGERGIKTGLARAYRVFCLPGDDPAPLAAHNGEPHTILGQGDFRQELRT